MNYSVVDAVAKLLKQMATGGGQIDDHAIATLSAGATVEGGSCGLVRLIQKGEARRPRAKPDSRDPPARRHVACGRENGSCERQDALAFQILRSIKHTKEEGRADVDETENHVFAAAL